MGYPRSFILSAINRAPIGSLFSWSILRISMSFLCTIESIVVVAISPFLDYVQISIDLPFMDAYPVCIPFSSSKPHEVGIYVFSERIPYNAVGLQVIKRLFETSGERFYPMFLSLLLVQVEEVERGGLARVYLVLNSIKPCHQDDGKGKVWIAGWVRSAQFNTGAHAPCRRDAYH